MRRACSSEVRWRIVPSSSSQCSRRPGMSILAVEVSALDLGRDGGRHDVGDGLAPGGARPDGRRGDGERLELEELDPLRAPELGQHTTEPVSWISGPRRDAEANELEYAVRLLPVEERRQLVGADEEDRVVRPALLESVNGSCVLVQLDGGVRQSCEREAGELEARGGGAGGGPPPPRGRH